MPRYNIEHKEKYYVFSSICDGIIEEFDTFEELQNWRLIEYGKSSFENAKTFDELRGNKEELKNILTDMVCGGNIENEEIIKFFKLLNKNDMIYAYKDLLALAKDLKEEINNDNN